MIFDTLKQIRLCDGILASRQKTGRKATIDANLRFLNETGRMRAFKLDWKPGDECMPHIFWDSDTAKVMEGMALALLNEYDPVLAARLDEMVDQVISAQQPDGYLNTYFTTVEKNSPERRWSNLFNEHELYCAGHLIEAAVAHFEATGNRKFLDTMCRYADCIARGFGRAPGQKRGYPGHEEIELALVKLYRVTGEKRYLELAEYFIDERGTEPNYFVENEKVPVSALENRQAHIPVREQKTAVGHAVRAAYLYCGMADVAAETGDDELAAVTRRLFENMTQKRMYITGGIGSTPAGEAFTGDYNLPNDTAYTESCAAISVIFLAKRLLERYGESKYADVIERVLYNNALSGINLAGTAFFYSNPMQLDESSALVSEWQFRSRQEWFGCSCCPTTYCRFLPQLGTFCYTLRADLLRVDIPAAAVIDMPDFAAEITGSYPFGGDVEIRIRRGGDFTLAVRIPAWSPRVTLRINGEAVAPETHNGYWQCRRRWNPGDVVALELEITPRLVYAHARVASNAGRAAVMSGPVVYCLESTDNPGILLPTVKLPAKLQFRAKTVAGLPEGTVAFTAQARAVKNVPPTGELYTEQAPLYEETEVCFIPYALWQNRGESMMQTFVLAE